METDELAIEMDHKMVLSIFYLVECTNIYVDFFLALNGGLTKFWPRIKKKYIGCSLGDFILCILCQFYRKNCICYLIVSKDFYLR